MGLCDIWSSIRGYSVRVDACRLKYKMVLGRSRKSEIVTSLVRMRWQTRHLEGACRMDNELQAKENEDKGEAPRKAGGRVLSNGACHSQNIYMEMGISI